MLSPSNELQLFKAIFFFILALGAALCGNDFLNTCKIPSCQKQNIGPVFIEGLSRN